MLKDPYKRFELRLGEIIKVVFRNKKSKYIIKCTNQRDALIIAGDFQEYIRNGDKKLIEKYTILRIKGAMSFIPPNQRNELWYKEMERFISQKENKVFKSYFWDKIFPILLTVILTGIISFAVGFSLKVVEVKKLKAEVQTFETRESTIQSEIKKVVTSGNTSDLLDIFNKVNLRSPILAVDKLRTLETEENNLLEKLRLASAKSDGLSVSVISRELEKVREKIRRLKE